MRGDRRDENAKPNPKDEKRPYHSPELTEYGTVDELVDGGVMGTMVVPL